MNAINVNITIDHGSFHSVIQCDSAERVTGLIGQSGSGKTTLLHALCGLLRPTSGRIEINGTVVYDSAAGINLRPEQRGIGMVFQSGRLFPHRSVRSNLRFGRRRGLRRASAPQFDDVVELLELSALFDRRPHELSGGEQRRVALGRALLSGPELLLLDEPLAGLDDRLKAQVIPLLRRVRDVSTTPMVYVCHDVTELLQITSHSIVLVGGRVVGAGLLRDVAQQSGSVSAVRDLGYTNVLQCQPAAVQDEPGVTLLDILHGDDDESVARPKVLRAPQRTQVLTSSVRIAIRPQDIALAPAAIPNISIQNQIEGRVSAVTSSDHGVLVELDIGTPVLVQITERARDALHVEPGAELCCLIKSTAIEYLP